MTARYTQRQTLPATALEGRIVAALEAAAAETGEPWTTMHSGRRPRHDVRRGARAERDGLRPVQGRHQPPPRRGGEARRRGPRGGDHPERDRSAPVATAGRRPPRPARGRALRRDDGGGAGGARPRRRSGARRRGDHLAGFAVAALLAVPSLVSGASTSGVLLAVRRRRALRPRRLPGSLIVAVRYAGPRARRSSSEPRRLSRCCWPWRSSTSRSGRRCSSARR